MIHAPRPSADRPARLVALLALAAFAVALLPSPGVAADRIPLDANGLPQWEIAVYDDFPVRIELESRAALDELLQRVPIAAFSREDVRPEFRAGAVVRVVLEPRVTEAEAEALERAGYAYERLPDLEQEGRRAMEAEWMRQAEIGGETLGRGTRGTYHTHAQMVAILDQAAADHSAIARTYSMGNSVQGRSLYMIEISDNVGTEEAEPEVRLSAGIHGNERPAMEMLIYLVDHLTDQYGVDPDVTYLVDNYEIHLLPCHNPDGLTAGTRYNSNGMDLNRNFPVPSGLQGDDGTWNEEVETVLFKNHGTARNFVISGNGHTGALVVNYPWDWTYALAYDNDAMIDLSLEYSTYNLPMYNGSFSQGITNGAQWYVVHGSLQDWSYNVTGCIDVTLELSNSHSPPASALDGLWDDNRDSYMHYVKAARYGIHGVVTDAGTGQPIDAAVTVIGSSISKIPALLS